MTVERQEVEAPGNPQHDTRFQIIPLKTRIPEEKAISKEAAHLIRKNHTKMKGAERPTLVGEVVEFI